MAITIISIGIIGVAIYSNVFKAIEGSLGGTTNFDTVDTSDGYKVDGTTVIDGSGNVDAPITSTTGTFSSTLTVTATTTVGTSDLVVQTDLDRIGVGTTTPLDLFQVENSSATTTVIVSSGASAKGGRIIIEDADGAGCSELTTINGSVAAKTVTCPTGI